MSGTISLNGETCALDDDALLNLLRAQKIDPAARGLAVAVNGAVVPRRAWEETALRDGDEVEIVKLFAGG
jgi:sulfur carrier protein